MGLEREPVRSSSTNSNPIASTRDSISRSRDFRFMGTQTQQKSGGTSPHFATGNEVPGSSLQQCNGFRWQKQGQYSPESRPAADDSHCRPPADRLAHAHSRGSRAPRERRGTAHSLDYSDPAVVERSASPNFLVPHLRRPPRTFQDREPRVARVASVDPRPLTEVEPGPTPVLDHSRMSARAAQPWFRGRIHRWLYLDHRSDGDRVAPSRRALHPPRGPRGCTDYNPAEPVRIPMTPICLSAQPARWEKKGESAHRVQ